VLVCLWYSACVDGNKSKIAISFQGPSIQPKHSDQAFIPSIQTNHSDHTTMLQRLYVHNFRCLENFELKLDGEPSSLLIGKNGVGKSAIADALTLLQRIGRGVNRVGQLIKEKDIGFGRFDVPIRFELEVLLGGVVFKYVLALELPVGGRELRVLEESLMVGSVCVYARKSGQVEVNPSKANATGQFLVDWHLIALPIIQAQSASDPLLVFKTWLAQMIILAPIPALMSGESSGEGALLPKRDASNFGDWFSGLLGQYPAAYRTIDEYLRQIMPDFGDIQNAMVGKEAKSMLVQFAANGNNFRIQFDDLSDGEKCFFLCAVVLAANKHYGPLFCFWDEPDNYLSLSEVGHFVIALRRSFSNGGQLLITSHNEEAIRKFSDNNTWIVDRKSHLEPTLLRHLDEVPVAGDLVSALIRGDVGL
jgi:ABC-type cobalamin/Fe3+-siderophores transport system ATPase subunit